MYRTSGRSDCGVELCGSGINVADWLPPGAHDHVAKLVPIVVDGMSISQELLIHLSTVIDLELSYLSTLFG
ncbi:hypothetical protein ABZ478_29580 [Streptomyces sp. NPDC005706]|uniref:hypothetical protein n=1 Tax=Streptomyces sp. NPDC005706 TaxID=3157169 RepID=UPI003404690F